MKQRATRGGGENRAHPEGLRMHRPEQQYGNCQEKPEADQNRNISIHQSENTTLIRCDSQVLDVCNENRSDEPQKQALLFQYSRRNDRRYCGQGRTRRIRMVVSEVPRSAIAAEPSRKDRSG